MPNTHKYILWIFFWVSLGVKAAPMSDPLKITRATPVFVEPSAKSKVVADLEKDTVLLFRDISPRGTWVLVEDVDGNKGWVPRERTDYKDFSEPLLKSPLEKKKDQPLIQDGKAAPPLADEMPDTEEENTKDISAAFSMDQPQHVIALRARASEFDPGYKKNSNNTYLGMTYEFFSPQKEAYGESLQRTGILVGFLKSSSSFVIPLRMEYLTQFNALSTSFMMGADLGFVYFQGSHWHPSLGYNFQWGHLGKSDWRVGLRPGIEFFPARPSIEFYLGRSL